jgi:hypothetical protein
MYHEYEQSLACNEPDPTDEEMGETGDDVMDQCDSEDFDCLEDFLDWLYQQGDLS